MSALYEEEKNYLAFGICYSLSRFSLVKSAAKQKQCRKLWYILFKTLKYSSGLKICLPFCRFEHTVIISAFRSKKLKCERLFWWYFRLIYDIMQLYGWVFWDTVVEILSSCPQIYFLTSTCKFFRYEHSNSLRL